MDNVAPDTNFKVIDTRSPDTQARVAKVAGDRRMRIIFCDFNPALVNSWRAYCPDVEAIRGDFFSVCEMERITAIVSPANSFGYMDGGIDLAISERYGWDIQARLQEAIAARPMKELLVGQAITIPINREQAPCMCICAPTMRFPGPIAKNNVVDVFLATKAALIEATERGCESVILTGMGAGTGCLSPDECAKMMGEAASFVLQRGVCA